MSHGMAASRALHAIRSIIRDAERCLRRARKRGGAQPIFELQPLEKRLFLSGRGILTYFTNFDNGLSNTPGGTWGSSTISQYWDQGDTAYDLGHYLGPFASADSTSLTLSLVPGFAYQVKFDLIVMDGWTGNAGPNWQVTLNGQTQPLFSSNFAENWPTMGYGSFTNNLQGYGGPDFYSGSYAAATGGGPGNIPAGTGDADHDLSEINPNNNPLCMVSIADSDYYITLPAFTPTTRSTTLTFSVTSALGGNVLTPDGGTYNSNPKWGLDNVHVEPVAVAPRVCTCPVPATVQETAQTVAQDTVAAAISTATDVLQGIGAVVTAAQDLVSSALGAWGQGRSWSNQSPGGSANGNGWTNTNAPYLLPANTYNNDGTVAQYTLVEISNASVADSRWFDSPDNIHWTARYFLPDTLTNLSGGGYALADSTGMTNEFGPLNVTLGFAPFTGRVDSFGNTTSVIGQFSDGSPEEIRQTSGNTIEDYLYGESAGQSSAVVLRTSANGGTTWNYEREVDYAYYGAGAPGGNAGDLMSATLRVGNVTTGAGAVIGTTFYRYYAAADAPSPNDVGDIKYIFNPPSYARLIAAGLNPVTIASGSGDSVLLPYADAYYGYDNQNRVTSAIVQGYGCSCSGATGQGSYTYQYLPTTSGKADFNTMYQTTTVTLPNSPLNGQVIQDVIQTNVYGEVLQEDDKAGSTTLTTKYNYDSQGRVVLITHPSGLEDHYIYGGSGNNLSEVDQISAAGLAEIESWSYEPQTLTFGGLPTATDYLVTSDTLYGTVGGGDARTTSYAYYFASSGQLQMMTTSLPAIANAQNGDAAAHFQIDFFNTIGQVVWSQDPGGFFTYTEYDPVTGAVTKTIDDVDYNKLTSAQQQLFNTDAGIVNGDLDETAWSRPTGGVNAVTQIVPDVTGRPHEITDPNGNVTVIAYNDPDHRVTTYSGYNVASNTVTGPIEVSREDWANGYVDAIGFTGTPVLGTDGLPAGTENLAAMTLQSFSRELLNNSGQTIETDDYFNLSGLAWSSTGTPQLAGATVSNNSAAGNISQTFFEYDDAGNLERTQEPTGTIDRTVYDGFNRPVSQWTGTNDTTGNGNEWSPTNQGTANLVDIQDSVYDNGGAGDSNLTQVTQHVDISSADDRVNNYLYDGRDRLVAEKIGDSGTQTDGAHRPIYYFVLDNLGEVLRTYQFDGDAVNLTDFAGTASTDAIPTADAGKVRALTVTGYDDQGREYQSQQYSIDQVNGTSGLTDTQILALPNLATNSYFDSRGDLVAVSNPGGLWNKSSFDGAGRDIMDSTTDGGQFNNPYLPQSAGLVAQAQSTTNDIVLEQTLHGYDAAGNEIETIQRQRFDSDPSSAAGQGNLNGPGGGNLASRDYYSAMYYDAANRLTASVDVGTNGGTAWTRPTSAPPRSDTALVTSTGYAADNVQEVVINGNPTGGTFELKFNGQTTTGIAYNATGLGVESALQSLLGNNNVMVTGPAGGPYFIEFAGSLGGSPQPIMIPVNGLTGGTSPGLSVSTVQTGGDAGYAQSVTDPRGNVSISNVDALGRTFRTVDDFTPGGLVSGASNQTTRWTFDGNNDTLSMTATSDEATYDGPDQTTAWVYGVGGTTGTNLFSNDLIHQTQYPDKTLGTPSPLAANDQTLAYDFLGEQTTFTDQNGTLHSYLRDVLGRLTADIVTTPGSGISQTVRRLGYAFDTAGRPYQQTSYSNTAGTGILNQVQDAYNGYGQLTAEYQNHTGAVNTSTTPKVVYGFAQPAGANYSRLSSMTYPNGRTVDDLYGGTSVISGITFSGTTATVTTATPDGLAVGSKVTISGASPTVYDGSFSVTSIIDATDFTVTLTGTPTVNASGTDMSAVASQQVPITTITHVGTTATVTTGGTHGLTVGSSITIQGASDSTYDGTFAIATIVNSTQFTYTLPATPGANAVGVDMLAIISTAATLDSTISRLTGMQDHVDGTVLESYQYLGLGTIAQKNRPQPGVDLSYIQQTGATGDGGDKYTGLDRFGRVDDQYWLNPSTGTVTDRFQYGYDRNSNVLYRNNLVNTSFGELYHTSAGSDQTGYDPLNRLTAFSRGTLVASGNNGTTLDKISTPSASNSWSLDALGNPTVIGTTNQNFNPQDQITSITGKTTPIYDANGNMTRDEAGHTYIYDAWNRMVSAYNGTSAEAISYDADNRRPGLSICGTTVTDSYYTTSWQDIEDDVVTYGCGGGTTKSTYVWSQSYIDDMVARDSSFNSGPVTRVYAEQDANHDTTSLVSSTGTALERFIYDPYGTRTVLNASSWSTGGDSQSWVFGYQGGRLDLTSGKINFRHRDLDTVTDTWMEKDPIGYAAGPNPYQDENSNPVILVDPAGLEVAGNAHMYPLFLGGPSKQVTFALKAEAHSAMHDYFRSLNFYSWTNDYVCVSQKAWAGLKVEQQRAIIKEGMRRAGIAESMIDQNIGNIMAGATPGQRQARLKTEVITGAQIQAARAAEQNVVRMSQQAAEELAAAEGAAAGLTKAGLEDLAKAKSLASGTISTIGLALILASVHGIQGFSDGRYCRQWFTKALSIADRIQLGQDVSPQEITDMTSGNLFGNTKNELINRVADGLGFEAGAAATGAGDAFDEFAQKFGAAAMQHIAPRGGH